MRKIKPYLCESMSEFNRLTRAYSHADCILINDAEVDTKGKTGKPFKDYRHVNYKIMFTIKDRAYNSIRIYL